MGTKQPVSRLINVSVVLTPQAAQAQDLSTLLVLGTAEVIDVVERIRTYATLDAVALDFGVDGAEYKSSVLYFGQSPQPTQIKIGRWADADSAGQLMCAALSAANQQMAPWNAIANGGFNVDVNGVAQPVGPCNLTAAANLNAVAAIIQAATPGVTVTYDAVRKRFVFTSNTVGAGSSVGFLSAGGGTDISGMLGGAAGGGGYVANGIVAETAAAAVAIFDQRFGQGWYGVTIPELVDHDATIAVAAYIEGSNNKHLHGVSTQEAGVLSAVSVDDIAFLLSEAGYKRTMDQYSSSSAYSVASLMGRAFTVDWNGNATAITLMFKQEPGIVGEEITTSELDALEAKNCNIFVDYQNDTAIIEPGKMASGDFIDELTGTDWLAVTIMTALYNLLYTSPTKIPQTDAGVHLLTTTAESVCSQGVLNGLLAPGVWNSGGFGTLKQGDYLQRGFYVYAPPVASQTQADRAARKSPPIQIAAKLAGAVHSVDVVINVNR